MEGPPRGDKGVNPGWVLIAVAPPAPGEKLSSADRQLLAAIARLTAARRRDRAPFLACSCRLRIYLRYIRSIETSSRTRSSASLS